MRGANMNEIAVNIISGVVRQELSAMNVVDEEMVEFSNVLISEDSIEMKNDAIGIEKDPDDLDDIELKEYLGEESLYLLMEEVLKSLQQNINDDDFIESLYEENNEFNTLDDSEDIDISAIVCPFCKYSNMKIVENEGYGHCLGCGIHISLYSSIYNRQITLNELRSHLADSLDQHGNGTCCNFDNNIDPNHLQFTCFNQKVHITCLACRYSGNLF